MLLPRRLGAKLHPPTLFLELADSESGQIFHHRLLLNDKALSGDVRAIVDELSHAAPDFTQSPALKAEVMKMVATLQSSKRSPGQGMQTTQQTPPTTEAPLPSTVSAAGRPMTPDGHERLAERGRPRLGAAYAAGSEDTFTTLPTAPLQRGASALPSAAVAATAALSPPARAVGSPSSSFDLGDTSYISPSPAVQLSLAAQSMPRTTVRGSAEPATVAVRASSGDPHRLSSTELEGRAGTVTPATPSLDTYQPRAVGSGYHSSVASGLRDPESSDDSYSDLMDPQAYRRGTGAASTATEAPSRPHISSVDGSSTAGLARSAAGVGVSSRVQASSSSSAPPPRGAAATPVAGSLDAAAERVSADVVALVTSIGDLQHAGQAQLQAAKAKMDILFDAVRLKPGDPGYEFDKRVEFQAPQETSEWDDE